ncbi:MAG: alanine--tRNA ligase-related protein, partial [Bacillus sp. (in: firmicutes)]
MTHKLYYKSSYIKDWETTITNVIQKEDDTFLILDETAFYPHGGGQPCDSGTINGIDVLDVISEGDKVLHKVETVPVESKVHCELDWQKRFDHMQHHSGQHLLSAVCLQMYEAKTVSFHLGNDFVTIDLDV